MSYVQGTTVRLQADFSDPETHEPVMPAEVVLTVEPPTLPVFERTLSAGEVLPDAERAGRFYYLLDTGAEPGTWRYQFEDPTADAGVVQRKEVTVTRRLPAPA